MTGARVDVSSKISTWTNFHKFLVILVLSFTPGSGSTWIISRLCTLKLGESKLLQGKSIVE